MTLLMRVQITSWMFAIFVLINLVQGYSEIQRACFFMAWCIFTAVYYIIKALEERR